MQIQKQYVKCLLVVRFNPNEKATTKVEEQKPCCFGTLLVDRASGKSVYKSSRGPNCIGVFFNYIRTKAAELSRAKQNLRI